MALTSTRSVFHTIERSLRPTSFSDSTMSSTFLHPSSSVSYTNSRPQTVSLQALQHKLGLLAFTAACMLTSNNFHTTDNKDSTLGGKLLEALGVG